MPGYISARFESLGKPEQTPPDTGEQSYGTYQLLGDPPKKGGDPVVVKFLKSSGYYKTNFSNTTVNSPEFKATWKKLGETDPLFGAAQHQFILEEHFQPLAKYAVSFGLERTPAIDEALFSIGVQHNKARKIFDEAAKKVDLHRASETEVINALYSARIEYVQGLIKRGIGRATDLQQVIEKRYPAEQQAVLQIVNPQAPSLKTLDERFQQLGLSPAEAKQAAEATFGQDTFKPDEITKNLDEILAWYKKNPNINSTEENDSDDEDDAAVPPTTVPASSTSPSDVEALEKKRQQDYQSAKVFLGFLDKLGEGIHIKPLSNIAQAGGHLLDAYEAINSLSGFTSLTSVAALGPIGALGGAVLGIISLFGGGGPSPTQIILNQIQHLSEQIADLRNFLSENFNQLYKLHEATLNTIYHGFNVLTLELDNQVGSMRLDLTERLDKISVAILYIARQISLDIRELALQNLRETYHSTQTWIEAGQNNPIAGNPADKIPELALRLSFWASSESTSILYTGRTIYQTSPPNPVLRDILYAELNNPELQEDILTSSLIGYLASFYKKNGDKKITAAIDENRMPNARIWFDTAQRYLALKKAFLHYDADPANYQIEEILKAGVTIISFVNAIATDMVFWKFMCSRYENLTQAVSAYQYRYMEACSNTIKNICDERNAHAVFHHGPISEWDFMTSPDRLIAQMGTKGINNISSFQNQISVSNAKPICRALSYHSYLLSNTFVAAEYLGLASFSAEQEGAIPRPYCINPIFDNDYNEVDTKLNERGGKRQEGDTVIGKAGMEIFRKAAGSSERVTEWFLPIHVFLHTQNGKSDICRFNLVGRYDGLAVETAFWKQMVIVGWRSGSRGSEVPIQKPKYSMPGPGKGSYGYDLQAAIPGYIHDTWEKSEELAIIGQQELMSNEQINQTKKIIDDYFLTERKKIAALLNADSDSYAETDVERQKNHSLYKDKLIELDIHVRLIRLFAYLAGKDLRYSVFADLSTSAKITAELNEFQRSAQLSTRLTHGQRELCAQDILNAPQADALQQLSHPKQWYAATYVTAEAYKNAQVLYKQQKPSQPTVAASSAASLEVSRYSIDSLAATGSGDPELSSAIRTSDKRIQLVSEHGHEDIPFRIFSAESYAKLPHSHLFSASASSDEQPKELAEADKHGQATPERQGQTHTL